MNYLLDTNAVIYFLSGRLASELPVGQCFVSVISEIELLSFKSIDEKAEKAIREFLGKITVIGLTQPVKERTIQLRRRFALKTPDAIIAASAVELGADLLTNDQALLHIPEVRGRGLELKG